MSNPALVVAGDLHLAPYITAKIPEMVGDSVHSLQQIIKFCLDHGVDLVLAGDVMDSKFPGTPEVEALGTAVRAMLNKGLSVYGIQGQHDHSDPPWPSVVGAALLSGEQVKCKELTVAGLDYLPKLELQEALPNVPPCDVLILHQMLSEAVNFRDPDGAIFDLEADDIPEHVKLCIMGDIHIPYSNEAHKPPIHYTGSMHLRKIDEPIEKSFIVVHDDLSVHRVPLDVRPFSLYDLFTEEGFKECLDNLRAYDPESMYIGRTPNVDKPYVIVRFDHRLENVRERVAVAAKDKFFLRLLPRGTVEQIGEETKAIKGTITLEGCLGEFAKEADNPQLYAFVSELITAEDARQVIGVWKDKVVGE